MSFRLVDRRQFCSMPSALSATEQRSVSLGRRPLALQVACDRDCNVRETITAGLIKVWLCDNGGSGNPLHHRGISAVPRSHFGLPICAGSNSDLPRTSALCVHETDRAVL